MAYGMVYSPGNSVGSVWQLSDGHQWLPINNDHVIETHYRHPGVKGITLHLGAGRQLVIDFDSMQTSDGAVKVQRLVHQAEDVGWYFRDDHLWREYGSQQSHGKHSSSITSKDLEHQFTINPQGSVYFNVGSVQYALNFSSMTQTNLVTNMNRKVRRRPKLTSSIVSSVTGPRWQFIDTDGQWKDYTTDRCSISSEYIEVEYQQNQVGTLLFNTWNFKYELNFAGMTQKNLSTNTIRTVRRSLD